VEGFNAHKSRELPNIYVPTHFFRTKVTLKKILFTQMEKSLGSGRKKVVSGHRNQTLFSFRLIINFIKVPQPFSSLVNFKVY